MTCIAAFFHKGKVFLGADSLASNSYHQYNINGGGKIFFKNEYAFGATGSFRAKQILEIAELPKIPKENIRHFMITEFHTAIRKAFRDAGRLHKENEVEELYDGDSFIVIVKSLIFKFQDDLSILEPSDRFCSIGSGCDFALSAMFAARKMKLSGRAAINLALETAERFAVGVRRPFKIIELPARIGGKNERG